MAWKLPDGKVINAPKGFTHDGLQYPAQIFRSWSKEELAAIGVKPYRELKDYDSRWFWSGERVEEEVDGEVVVSHPSPKKKMTNAEAKEHQVGFIRLRYLNEMPRAQSMVDFYDAVGDNDTKKLWSDYITALKNDAKTLKDAVDAAGTYDAIKNLDLFQWSPAPDAEVPEEEEEVVE